MSRRLTLLATTLVVLALAVVPTTALAAGAMRLSPDPVDYHRVKVGTAYTKKITVKNVGDTTLNILAYTVWDFENAHGWAIGNSTCGTLAPGDRCRFELELTPHVAGDIAVGVDVRS